ncbi:11226_t:CDS:2, partial [Racocetra fulgida]
TTDDSYQEEIAREDDYDQPQSLFSSLLKGYAKKVLDLAIHANKVDDFVNKIEYENVNSTNIDVIVEDLLRVQHKEIKREEGIANNVGKLAIMLHNAQI